MATATTKTTRELVEEQYDAGVDDAKEIAKKIKKEPATVYVHLRNIRNDRGIPSRGRGRPPKVDGDDNEKAEKATKSTKAATTRKAPPKAGQKQPKTKSDEAPAQVESKADTNGHASLEFPSIESAIRAELKKAQRQVKMLEGMLKPFES